MKNRLAAALAAAIVVLVVPYLVVAHHSATNFDTEKLVTLQGTVMVFHFINPHPHVYFQAKDAAGNVVEWIAESGTPPARWYNSGWRANFLKAGDQITIAGNPAKDGRKRLRILKIVNPGGQEYIEEDRVR